jgi:hypothetical protein
MPALVEFMITRFANGFLLGAATTLGLALAWPDSLPARVVSESLAGFILIIFAHGSSFGIGMLATGLWLDFNEE